MIDESVSQQVPLSHLWTRGLFRRRPDDGARPRDGDAEIRLGGGTAAAPARRGGGGTGRGAPAREPPGSRRPAAPQPSACASLRFAAGPGGSVSSGEPEGAVTGP